MGTYRVEWGCCGSVTETDAWEPSECPICAPRSPADAAMSKDAARYRWLRGNTYPSQNDHRKETWAMLSIYEFPRKCRNVERLMLYDENIDAAIDAAMNGANA